MSPELLVFIIALAIFIKLTHVFTHGTYQGYRQTMEEKPKRRPHHIRAADGELLEVVEDGGMPIDDWLLHEERKNGADTGGDILE